MRLGVRSVALAVAAMACSSAAIVGAACFIVPPPSTPDPPMEPPRIVSVLPPTNAPLPEWPNAFIVGVNPENPDQPTTPPEYYVFVDPPPSQPSPVIANQPPAMAPDNDAGVWTIAFLPSSLGPSFDDMACHTVLLVVARRFTGYVADSPGAAIVTWNYAGPNAPYGCVRSPLDGQPPPPDAADGAFTPPSEGGGLDP